MAYNANKAKEYWNSRAKSTDQVQAVLSFGLPDYINEAYSKWEIGMVLRELSNIKTKRVLDIGCGVGRVTVPVAKQGAYVMGVDISGAMLDICRKNIESAGVKENVELSKIRNASELPLSDDSFDAVLCLGILEHLPPNIREQVLSEISRVTRTGGITLIIVNNGESLFLQKMDRYRMEHQQENGYFVGLMERKKIEATLQKNGFEVEEAGSNLLYSLARHLTEPLQKSERDILPWDSLFNLCVELDLKFKNKGDLDGRFTDQWLIKGVKRGR